MDQFEHALNIAYGQTASYEMQQQALQYCDQLRETDEGIQLSIQVFTAIPKRNPHTRHFALQVLEHQLTNRFSQMKVEVLMWIREQLWNYLLTYYVNSEQGDESFIETKFSIVIAHLFRRLYMEHWSSFFQDLLALLNVNQDPHTQKSINMAYFFLRVMTAIDQEVVDLTKARTKDEVNLNTNLKDKMREGDLQRLVPVWFQIIYLYQSNNYDLAVRAFDVMGAFSDWIDINLVVTEPFINLVFQMLQSSTENLTSFQLRNAACECLTKIVSKGKRPAEQVQFLQMIGIVKLIPTIPEDQPEFVETVAKLVNAIGIELHSAYDQTTDPSVKEASYAMILELQPHLLKFLSNEYDDTSNCVYPFVNESINLLKNQQKKFKQPLTPEQNQFLENLLKVIMTKMKHDSEDDWGDDADEDDEALFYDMRRHLKTFFESIGALNEPLFNQHVSNFVISVFSTPVNSDSDWTPIELALYLLNSYREVNKRPAIFVEENNSNQLTLLGVMVEKMLTSQVMNHTHPSIHVGFFENVIRYHTFLQLRPDLILSILTPFLDQRGVYNPCNSVRSRIWYLFYKFVRSLKAEVGKYTEQIVPSLQKALNIRAEVPPPGFGEVSTSQHENTGTEFDNQLYLFEAVGALISSADHLSSDQTINFLGMILSPMIRDIQAGTQQAKQGIPEDPLFILQLNHIVMAIGGVTKGFPDFSAENPSANAPYIPIFKQAVEAILLLLEATGQAHLIRDASRYTFSRLLACAGPEILPYLTHLINGLLVACEIGEFSDFLTFIGFVAFKFKIQIAPVMNELLSVLVKKAFGFFEITPSGTDEANMLTELKKTYLTFLTAIFNADMEAILRSQANQPILPDILKSVEHFTKDLRLPAIQKLSFNILSKMIAAWLGEVDKLRDPPVTDDFRNQFSEFIFKTIIPSMFQVILSPEFDVEDAQSLIVLNESTAIQKSLLEVSGPRFLEYLHQFILPSLNFSPAHQQEYVEALQTLDVKNFRKYFRELMRSAKAART